MSRKKLTLSVQKRLTKRAKEIARKRGTSVSRLVETFFTALEEENQHALEQPVEEQSADGRSSETNEGEFSEWARRWRGAFAEEGKAYPDDPSWEEGLLREEIEKKHAPQ